MKVEVHMFSFNELVKFISNVTFESVMSYINENICCLFHIVLIWPREATLIGVYMNFLRDIAELYGTLVGTIIFILSALSLVLLMIQQLTLLGTYVEAKIHKRFPQNRARILKVRTRLNQIPESVRTSFTW